MAAGSMGSMGMGQYRQYLWNIMEPSEFLGMNIQPLECCLGVWLPGSRHQALTHDPSYYFDGPQKDERKKHHENWEDSSFYLFGTVVQRIPLSIGTTEYLLYHEISLFWHLCHQSLFVSGTRVFCDPDQWGWQ